MTGLVLSNLDASTSPYHRGHQNGMPWFAILNKDRSPRPAWKAFKAWREGEGVQASRRSRPAAGAQPRSTSSLPPPPSLGQAGPAEQAAPLPALDLPGAASEPASGSATPMPSVTPESGPKPDPSALVPDPATTPTPAPARFKVGKTDGTGANLRERPSSDARAIAILLDGTTVEVVGDDVQSGGLSWRNVRTTGSTADGVTGWVAAQYLVP
jgi:hypothetical protein